MPKAAAGKASATASRNSSRACGSICSRIQRLPPKTSAVRVTDVRRRPTADGAVLLLSLRLSCDGGEGKRNVPLHFDIEGALSELTVDMEGPELELKNHRIPLSGDRLRGWGRVTIPADENPADNEFFFVFDAAAAPPHRARDGEPTGHAPLGTRGRQLARSGGHLQLGSAGPGPIGRRRLGKDCARALASAAANGRNRRHDCDNSWPMAGRSCSSRRASRVRNRSSAHVEGVGVAARADPR